MTIHFIITGGTIDSYHDEQQNKDIPNKKSIIPDYISSLKLYNSTEFSVVCLKDSRDLTKKDLEKIIKTVEKSPHTKIIISHGTFTIAETGRYLIKNIKRKDQTVILTGAMIPIKGFSDSDGPFNLGYALASFKNIKPGIYICMNGKLFSPEKVEKNINEGRFIDI